MRQYEGKIAVVTGGGSGMGRELCVQLASEGCHVALCDVSPEALEQTRALCVSAAPKGVRISTFETDVSDEELQGIRDQMERMGLEVDGVGDDEIRKILEDRGEAFRDEAPLTASQAATIILDGVRAGSWRILVGEDAHVLDRLVREDPEQACEASFAERLQAETPWQLGDLDAPGGP